MEIIEEVNKIQRKEVYNEDLQSMEIIEEVYYEALQSMEIIEEVNKIQRKEVYNEDLQSMEIIEEVNKIEEVYNGD